MKGPREVSSRARFFVSRMGISMALGILFVGFIWPLPIGAIQPDFQVWLLGLRKEAKQRGISTKVLDEALGGVAPIPQIIKLDRHQPEFTMTLREYVRRVVTERRVSEGRRKLREHASLLSAISGRYGVGPSYLVALWGIETNFGRTRGSFPVIGATVTLAYDGRRSQFFRNELFQALKILEEGHTSPDELVGSWAGASGQFHFMPSTFQRFAVDYDGDGKKDMWNNLGDAFASAANYLSKSGWKSAEGWGREVRLPEKFDRRLLGLEHRKRVSEWDFLGVKGTGSAALFPPRDLWASIVNPDGVHGKVYEVYGNYRALLNWNRSHLFGIAVGVLAERIGSP